ncbi:MAG TPA: pyruvate kinase [Methylophilaceae bacterium]
MNIRKTKIVATLGPASSNPVMLHSLMEAGVDVMRLNFSHGTAQEHIDRAKLIREISFARRRSIGILCDLQGPKIRIGKFENSKISIATGAKFILDANCPLGNQQRVGLDYKTLPNEVEAGTVLLLDDGRIVMQVDRVQGAEIFCTITTGGILSNNKGINRQGGGLAAEALTDKDRADIKTAAALGADYVAISFPRCAADVELARTLVREAGGHAHIVAKIERAEAIEALEEITEAADVIMVARGDLGVEVGDAAVPGLQKRMIKLARARNKVVITATQMMESMISSPIPTRAEVSDVANAVLDGTDAVMLSAETAAGQYPIETVQAVHRVCIEAEKEYDSHTIKRRAEDQFEKLDEAIAMTAIYAAHHFNVKAIVALTQSGSTAKWMSRANTNVPIYALSPLSSTRRKLKLYRGVYPCPMELDSHNRDEVLNYAEDELMRQGGAVIGDMVIITNGEPIGLAGSTNALKIIKVGEHRKS